MTLRTLVAFAALVAGGLTPALAADAALDAARLKEERARQEQIYHGTGEKHLDLYVIDRGLAEYTNIFGEPFDRTLAALGADDRWLDIGAGMGLAIMDYLGSAYTPQYATRARDDKRARTVAMSIEDRRTPYWHLMAAHREARQMQYVHSKRLREYTREDLGQFQLITDVIGGFSYSENLSLFMEKTLGFLTVNGTFYTLLQDVRHEAGANSPHYANAGFLTEVRTADGAELPVCRWLKSITCVAVTCQPRTDWKPPVEVYQVRKTCEDVKVPALAPTRFIAGTPPERGFRLAAPAANASGQ
jgi:hypothetical protein